MDQALLTLQQRLTIPSPDTVRRSQQCSICWTDYSEDDSAVQIQCGHVFGQSCILAWAQGTKPNGRYNGCPTCRAELLPPSLHSRTAALVWWWGSFWQDFHTFIGGGCVDALFLAVVLGCFGAGLFPEFWPVVLLMSWSSVCLSIVVFYRVEKLVGWNIVVSMIAPSVLGGVVAIVLAVLAKSLLSSD